MNKPIVVAAVFTMLVLSGCAPELVEPIVDPLTLEQISAERLWQRITEDAPFQSYSSWPGDEGVHPGQAPHGSFHSIYINRTLRDALPRSDRIAPFGSVIVKESLDANRELTAYTVMAKVEGFNPDHGDWYWAVYGPDGAARVAGGIESCIVCHAGMRSNDYIIVRLLDEPIVDD